MVTVTLGKVVRGRHVLRCPVSTEKVLSWMTKGLGQLRVHERRGRFRFGLIYQNIGRLCGDNSVGGVRSMEHFVGRWLTTAFIGQIDQGICGMSNLTEDTTVSHCKSFGVFFGSDVCNLPEN